MDLIPETEEVGVSLKYLKPEVGVHSNKNQAVISDFDYLYSQVKTMDENLLFDDKKWE